MVRRALAAVLLGVLSAAAWAQPPREAVARYEKGMAAKRAGKAPLAVTEFLAAIQLHPRYMEAHYALAWVYRETGAADKAVEAFREVIRIAPHSPEAIEAARAIQRIRLGPGAAEGRERIAFTSTRDGNTDLYAMELSGGGLVRITSHPAVDDSPQWSPDGRRLAFVSERDGNREVYLTNIDGSGVQRVTDNPAVDDHPVWSPDGRQIALESNRGGNMDVYVVGADGAGLRQVSFSAADDWMGDWSPDGRQLAILSARDGITKVYVVGADGANVRRLVANNVPEGRPVWGHDGTHIFFSWNFERNIQVCRASLAGKGLANVTRSPYNDRLCDVSRDGRRLLVVSDRQRDEELYLSEMDTGAARRLTFNPGADRDGVFAPPGK